MRLARLTALTTVTLALLAAPLAGEAETHLVRVGLLGPDEEPRFSEIASNLKRGLREQGDRDDAFEVLESRVPRGDSPAARAAVQEFMSRRVGVILAVGSVLARVAREAAP